MRSEHGFTLLETVLALACTGLVLAAAGRAVTRAAAVRSDAGTRAATTGDARAALLALSDVLPAALPGSLRVESTAELRFSVADPAPTTLAFARDGDRLVRRAVPAFAPPGTAATAVTVVDAVERFDVRVLGRDGWTARWQDDRLPRAVEIRVDVAGEPPLTLRIALPMRGRG